MSFQSTLDDTPVRRAILPISLAALGRMLNLPEGVTLIQVKEDDLSGRVLLLLQSEAFKPYSSHYVPPFVDIRFCQEYDAGGSPLPIRWEWQMPPEGDD